MRKRKSLMRGIAAGVAGGLAASWVMNVFMAGPGQKIQRAAAGLPEDAKNPQNKNPQNNERHEELKEDATMKAADAIVSAATGGHHLTWSQKKWGGPIVHYTFGAFMGALYGALAEYSRGATAGFGTTFGGVLFGFADLLAVPALDLSSSKSSSVSSLASPFAGHIVYGITTEAVRRVTRALI